MTKFMAFDIETGELNAVLFATKRNREKLLPKKLGELSICLQDKNAKKKFIAFTKKADILLMYGAYIGYLDFFLLKDRTLMFGRSHDFIVIDVREMAKRKPLAEITKGTCKNKSEAIMYAFTHFHEMCNFISLAPHYR